MRLLPIIAAAAIGLFATAAMAQSSNTADPNSAPGASATGGKPKAVNPADVRRSNTADPNSAPGASTAGGKAKAPTSAEVKKMDTSDPNSAPGASATGGKTKKKMKKANKT